MEKPNHTTISISLALAEKIDKALEKWGYQSRSEFARDAIRRQLEAAAK